VEWVGISHYSDLLSSARFWQSVATTFIFTIASDAIATIGGLAIALLFTQQFRAKGLLRALVLIPYIAPLVAGAYIWRWMFHPVNGVITHYGVQLGLFPPTPEPLTSAGTALSLVILFDGWRHIPFAFLFFTARLQAIPGELYEAAEIDGAGKYAVFKDITLPELKHTIAIVVMLRFIWNFHKFAPVWLVTNHVETLSVFTYKTAFASFEYGTAAAISIIIVLMLLALATVYMRYFIEDW
jgi:multiple sugar transport system permease protein